MEKSFSLPIWQGGRLAGVLSASIRADSERGCTNACRTNANARRVGGAAAKFASSSTGVGALAWVNSTSRLEAAAKGLFQSYTSTRSSTRAPSMGVGTQGGVYIEVISCPDYGKSDPGCNAAPAGTTNLICVTAPLVFNHANLTYFMVNSQGDINASNVLYESLGSYDPRVRPWYKEGVSGGGFGAPYKLAGVIGNVFGQTYTQPVYMGNPLTPVLLGVVWADFKSVGTTATGCTDACETNSYGVRGGRAGASAVASQGLVFNETVTWSNITVLAKSMYSTYLTVRSSLNSPSLALGAWDGTYIEVVSCLYYGAKDGGCVATGGTEPLLFVVVSPSLWNDTHFRYFVPGVGGALPSNGNGSAVFTDWSFSYDPRVRPWYKGGAGGGGVDAAFAVVGITGSMTASSYSTPIWSSGGGLAGVVTAGIRSGSEKGCTNACRTNGNAPRVVQAVASFVSGSVTTVATLSTEAGLAAVAKGVYTAFASSRSSVNSGPVGLGTRNGTYIEIVSCAYYNGRDPGCNAAAPGTTSVVAVVSPAVFNHSGWVYYAVSERGDMDTVNGPLYTNSTATYNPVVRPWYEDGANGGGFGAPYAMEGVIGNVTAVTFTVPVYMGSPTSPELLAVVFSDLPSTSAVGNATSGSSAGASAGAPTCTDACRVNNVANRGGTATARAVFQTRQSILRGTHQQGRFFGSGVEPTATHSGVGALIRAMYQATIRTRAGLGSPMNALGTAEDGTYIEVSNCLFWAGIDEGCRAAGPDHVYVAAVVSDTLFFDRRTRYFYLDAGGNADLSRAAFHTSSALYDPRLRPWFALGEQGGGVSAPFTFATAVPRTGRTVSFPIYDSATGKLWGVVAAGMSGDTCTDSCQAASYGRRAAQAAAQAVWGNQTGSMGWNASRIDNSTLPLVARGLFQAYYASRDQLNSPSLGVANARGDYVEVVGCALFQHDPGCVAAGRAAGVVLAVRSETVFNDTNLHYHRFTSGGGVGAALALPNGTNTTYNPLTRPWFRQANASGAGFTAPFTFAVPSPTPLVGSVFTQPVFNAREPELRNLSGVAFGIRTSDAGCADGCRTNSFAPRAALSAAAALDTNPQLYRDISTMAQLQAAATPLWRIMRRDNVGMSPWVGIGMPNENVLLIINCRQRPTYFACSMGNSPAEYALVTRVDALFPDMGGRRVAFNLTADGQIDAMVGNQSNPYVTTARPWYNAPEWSSFRSFTAKITTNSYAWPVTNATSSAVLGVAIASTIGPIPCSSPQLDRSFAARATADLREFVAANASLFTAPVPVSSATTTAIAERLFAVYAQHNGGGDPGVSILTATSGSLYAAVSCVWGSSTPACANLPASVRLLFAVASPTSAADVGKPLSLRYYAYDSATGSVDLAATPVHTAVFNASAQTWNASVAGFGYTPFDSALGAVNGDCSLGTGVVRAAAGLSVYAEPVLQRAGNASSNNASAAAAAAAGPGPVRLVATVSGTNVASRRLTGTSTCLLNSYAPQGAMAAYRAAQGNRPAFFDGALLSSANVADVVSSLAATVNASRTSHGTASAVPGLNFSSTAGVASVSVHDCRALATATQAESESDAVVTACGAPGATTLVAAVVNASASNRTLVYATDVNGNPTALLVNASLSQNASVLNATTYTSVAWSGVAPLGDGRAAYSIPTYYTYLNTSSGAPVVTSLLMGVVSAARPVNEVCVGTLTQDCVLSAWGEWSACVVPGVQRRTRDVLTYPAGSGRRCNVTEESRPCAKDCVLSHWTPWSACSTCGGGRRNRTRRVLLPAYNSGACATVMSQEQGCGFAPCEVAETFACSASRATVCSTRRARAQVDASVSALAVATDVAVVGLGDITSMPSVKGFVTAVYDMSGVCAAYSGGNASYAGASLEWVLNAMGVSGVASGDVWQSFVNAANAASHHWAMYVPCMLWCGSVVCVGGAGGMS